MGSTAKKRWLIGIVLAGLVIATWLFWPSELDPRFVGTWRLSVTPYVYKLHADGTFTYEIHGEAVRTTQWRVRNGTFYNLYNHKGWDAARAWIDRIRKGKARMDQAYPVVSVTADAIVLKEPPNGNFVLLRVPDGFVPPKTKPGFQIEEDIDPVDKAHEKRMRAADPERFRD
ncbi:hypothetical protein AYO47_05595 [Planctomyces sp. SCGC AG-212-M04]|nr:hypothetical protein AYO47_05595 [Planctomyces sp. SCGC AG-212-M04]